MEVYCCKVLIHKVVKQEFHVFLKNQGYVLQSRTTTLKKLNKEIELTNL